MEIEEMRKWRLLEEDGESVLFHSSTKSLPIEDQLPGK